MNCAECNERRAEKDDPRDPPLALGACLCPECWEAAMLERIDVLERELARCRDSLKKGAHPPFAPRSDDR